MKERGKNKKPPKENSQNLSSSINASFQLQFGSFILYFSHFLSPLSFLGINKMSGGSVEARFPMLLLAHPKQFKVGVGVDVKMARTVTYSHLIYD